jgi:hypothetical protein
MGQQRQQLLRLQLAVGLLGEQAVEELHRSRAQLGEALLQQQRPLLRIVLRMMALAGLPHAALRARHQAMPGNLFQANRVERWACTRASARLTAPREMPRSLAIDRIDAPAWCRCTTS